MRHFVFARVKGRPHRDDDCYGCGDYLRDTGNRYYYQVLEKLPSSEKKLMHCCTIECCEQYANDICDCNPKFSSNGKNWDHVVEERESVLIPASSIKWSKTREELTVD
jgi:hypothetical protein